MIKCDESKPYIFISYSHIDSKKVYEIIEKLNDCGYNVWYDGGISPGSEWDQNIASHVKGCTYFIAFVSQAYISSENCKDELNFARDMDKERLLVYLEEVTLPDGLAMRMNRMQAIWWNKYASDDMDEAYDKLFSSQGIDKTKIREVKVIEEPVVQAQVESVQVAPVEVPQAQVSQESIMPVHKVDENSKKKTTILPWIVGVFACTALIVGLVLFLNSGKNDDNKKEDNTKTFVQESEVTTQDKIEEETQEEEKYYEEQEYGWYLQEAESGDEIAMVYLADCYYYGICGANKDGDKAFKWYTEASKGEDAEGRANCGLGNCYYAGVGTEQNYELAVSYYQKASEKGNADASLNLGCMYETGEGVEKDYEKVVLYYDRAANAGNATAMYKIGCMYYEGVGVKQDYEKAMSYYEMATYEDDPIANNILGYMHENGQGVDVDCEWALMYYEEAAELGNIDGMYNAGRLYYEGLGTEIDVDKAIEYLQKAAEAGHEKAIELLDEIS